MRWAVIQTVEIEHLTPVIEQYFPIFQIWKIQFRRCGNMDAGGHPTEQITDASVFAAEFAHKRIVKTYQLKIDVQVSLIH